MSTETAREGPEIPVAPPEAVLPAVRAPADLAWTIVQMRAGERITVNEGLIAAYQAASSPHSIRALKSDVEAFDAWCRRNNRIALPATPEIVADYLDARAGQGAKPASLGRYKAQSAPSCDFGQVGERFGNVAFGIDDGNHRRGQFAPS